MSNDDHKPEGRLPLGDIPDSLKNINITISGLEQWKDGIVSGAEVRIDILQKGKCIHSEVFNGKSTDGFTRTVSIPASFDDLIAVHNRPDLPWFKVTAEFSDPIISKGGSVFIKDSLIKEEANSRVTIGPMNVGIAATKNELSKETCEQIEETIRQGILLELLPGGLLHRR